MAQPNPIPPSSRSARPARGGPPFPAPASASASPSSKLARLPRTLNELYFATQERFGSRPLALRAKRNGEWYQLSYRELAERVQDLSIGLLDLGLATGDRVAILSENRPEWAIADYACLTARCTDVPIYPTLPARQVEYILRDSGSAAVFVSSQAQLEKVLAIRSRLPELRLIVAFDAVAPGPDVLTFAALLERGAAALDRHPAWRRHALDAAPDELATLIYTSGT